MSAPPLFHCYEKYSAIYGRSTLACTNCPDATMCHAKLTHVKGDIYMIGQCEYCRFDMVNLTRSSGLACSLQLIKLRMRANGTAVRINKDGEDVYPDGTLPLSAGPIVEIIPFVPYAGYDLHGRYHPKHDSKHLSMYGQGGYGMDGKDHKDGVFGNVIPADDSVAGFPTLSVIKHAKRGDKGFGGRFPPVGLISKLLKPSFSFSFSAFLSSSFSSPSSPTGPNLTPEESKTHPNPALVRRHSHSRTAPKTLAVGSTGSGPAGSPVKKNVRWSAK